MKACRWCITTLARRPQAKLAQEHRPEADSRRKSRSPDYGQRPDWQFPSIDLLNQKQDKADAGDVNGNAQIIHDTFANFNIEVEMEGANIGPRVTQYT